MTDFAQAPQISLSRTTHLASDGDRKRKLAACRPATMVWLFLLLLLSPLTSRAQELTATLSGIVTDSSGAVIPNAPITITENGVNAAVDSPPVMVGSRGGGGTCGAPGEP